MSIKLSECPCGSKKVSIPDFKGQCSDCHMSGPNGETENLGVLAWNILVEEIRVGRAIGTLLDAYPEKPWVLAAESPSFNLGSSHEEVENYIKWRICRRPVPAYVLDPLAVLDVIQPILDDLVKLGIPASNVLEGISKDIDTVRAQTGEGESK